MNVIHILCDTLRRDHCGPYHHGRPLNQVDSPQQPDWVVPTPNLDRLAARGTVFESAYAGSTPCMPARRDIYTGRYEFLERGWGPLEEGDRDLPSMLSPPHTYPITSYGPDDVVSYFISDHKNMWCAGSGNYHFGFSGFEFIRGQQEDPWATTSDEFYCPAPDKTSKLERYWRNKDRFGSRERDMPVARTFSSAAQWLRRNAGHRAFYLQIDEFDPHEPWDPPEEILRQFDPGGYPAGDWSSHPPYAKWREHMDAAALRSFQARYAGKVVLADRWLGKVLDAMDELDLWRNTMLILHTDHATFNGDHGRIGKLQTHEFAAKNMIPFIVYHPEVGHGERRPQLVQNVDIYATVLAAFGRQAPEGCHGVSLLEALADPAAPTRDYAIAGQFSRSATITDGRWTLHQGPDPAQPLYWYGYHQQRFYGGQQMLGRLHRRAPPGGTRPGAGRLPGNLAQRPGGRPQRTAQRRGRPPAAGGGAAGRPGRRLRPIRRTGGAARAVPPLVGGEGPPASRPLGAEA